MKSANEFSTEIIRPRIGRRIFLIILGLICFAIFGSFLALIDHVKWSEDHILVLSLTWLGASMAVLSFFHLIRGRPKLILKPEGLQYIGFFKSQFWKWVDVGPLKLFHFHVRGSHVFQVYASYDKHYDLLKSRQDTVDLANKGLLEIVFNITNFQVGKNKENAIDFVDKLNRWRAHYGAPEIEVNTDTFDIDHAQLMRKIRVGYLWTAVYCGVMLLILSLILYAAFR